MNVRALGLSVRSLREGTRSKAPFLLRGVLLAFLFLALWVAHRISFRASSSGAPLLWWVVWGDWVLLSLLAISAFSSVITEEKEVMTLGLLRLAGFTPLSIMLGKSVGALLNTLLLLVVQVPFCMLAVTLGGVTTGQVLAVFALLFAYTVFVYGMAMLCSVIASRNSKAAWLTCTGLVLYHFLPWIGRGIIHQISRPPTGWLAALDRFFEGWFESSVCYGLAQATGTAGSFMLPRFTEQASVNLGMGAVLLGMALVLFERFNRNEVPSAPARGFSFPWRRRKKTRVSQRCWSNALMWKDYRFLAGGVSRLVVRAVFYAGLFFVMYLVASPMRLKDLGEMMMVVMLIAVPLELTFQAGRIFQQEVKGKTLASLIALPHPLRHIAVSKVTGAMMLSLPGLCHFAVGAMLAPGDFGIAVARLAGEPGAWYFVALIVLLMHLTVYLSLRVNRGAMGIAIATLLLANMVLVLFASGCGFGGQPEGALVFLALVCVVICFVLQWAVGRRLRVLAAEG